MGTRATVRCRCVVCRRWYTPLARLAKQQRVCSAACRAVRRRDQARRRRAREPARYREEERERQRRRRERLRKGVPKDAEGHAPDGCHAPGETSKAVKSQDKASENWDEVKAEVIELSRAAFERQMRTIMRRIERKLGHRSHVEPHRSRAG